MCGNILDHFLLHPLIGKSDRLVSSFPSIVSEGTSFELESSSRKKICSLNFDKFSSERSQMSLFRLCIWLRCGVCFVQFAQPVKKRSLNMRRLTMNNNR